MQRGRDDADRHHRRRHASQRHQLPALRVPDRAAGIGGRRAWHDIADRLMPALDFDDSRVQHRVLRPPGRATSRSSRCNGRMASQFAPLVKAVHGVSTYELQLDSGHRRDARAAAGAQRPGGVELRAAHVRRRGRARPCPTRPRSLERFGHAHVEVLVRPGQRLSENDDDTASHRLAVVALAAPDRDAVLPALRRGGAAAAVRVGAGGRLSRKAEAGPALAARASALTSSSP